MARPLSGLVLSPTSFIEDFVNKFTFSLRDGLSCDMNVKENGLWGVRVYDLAAYGNFYDIDFLIDYSIENLNEVALNKPFDMFCYDPSVVHKFQEEDIKEAFGDQAKMAIVPFNRNNPSIGIIDYLKQHTDRERFYKEQFTDQNGSKSSKGFGLGHVN